MEDDIDEAPDPSSGSATKLVDPLQVLEVSPSELRIQCQLNTEVSYTFTLKNFVDRCVAFKVKTTAPRRYMVRPAQGTISSGDAVPITIVLVKMSQYPDQSNPRNLRDKFLVQSFALQHEVAVDELNALWVTKEKEHNPRANSRAYYEHRLKCRLLIPSEESQGPSQPLPVSPLADSAAGVSSDPADSVLGIVVSPPPDPAVDDVPSPSMKTPSSLQLKTPAEGGSDSAAALPTTTSDSAKESKGNSPESEPDATQSDQPGVHVENREKPAPVSNKNLDNTPLLANHPKEYEKILAYSVKLTVEREALESKLVKLSEQSSFLLQENERLRKALAIEQGISADAESSAASAEPKQRSVLDAIQASDTGYGPLFDQDFNFSRSHADNVASQLACSSGIQIWQVLAVAVLCFLIGRIF